MKNMESGKQLILVILVSVFFFLIYSYYSIYKYLTLNATGFDLGIYGASLHGYLYGNFFYSTLLNTSFFGTHFSPFIYVLAFFFWIFPHNATILVLQSLLITFTAIPLYLTYMKIAGNDSKFSAVFLLILCYEISPYSIGPIAFDFHLMALMPFFYAWALYFFVAKKPVGEGISLALMISLHASFIIFFLFYMTATRISRYAKRGLFTRMRQNLKKTVLLLSIYIALIFVAAEYFLIATNVRDFYGGTQYGNITSLHAFLNYLKIRYRITYSLQSLETYSSTKLVFLLFVIILGGFYAIFSPLLLLPSIPYFLFAFFSMNTAYFDPGFQYTAMLSPVIFAAAFVGLANMNKRQKNKKFLFRVPGRKVATGVMISAILVVAGIGYFSPVGSTIVSSSGSIFSGGLSAQVLPSIYNFHENMTSETIFELRGNISTNTCLLTQNNLYPEFDAFPNAYLLYSYTSVGNLSNLYSRNFTYIIADKFSNFYYQNALVGTSMARFIQHAESSGQYSIYLEKYGIIALKRN